jgi:hypothetical protein
MTIRYRYVERRLAGLRATGRFLQRGALPRGRLCLHLQRRVGPQPQQFRHGLGVAIVGTTVKRGSVGLVAAHKPLLDSRACQRVRTHIVARVDVRREPHQRGDDGGLARERRGMERRKSSDLNKRLDQA